MCAACIHLSSCVVPDFGAKHTLSPIRTHAGNTQMKSQN